VDSEQINSELDRHSKLTRAIKRIPHSEKDFFQAVQFMESKGIEEVAFRANLMLLTAWIPDLIYNSLRYEPLDIHRRLRELIDAVAKPWIHSLYELGYVYDEIAKRARIETRDSLFLPALNECDKYSEIMKEPLLFSSKGVESLLCHDNPYS